ncbi:MAG: CDP-diacylglycerol--glycerol-3-phosphate 3-phosphatidyltransferase [Candidatus Kapaibacteriales bacterium]
MNKINFPNFISAFRLLVSPIFFFLFTAGNSTYNTIGSILYLFAALTDVLDGWAARRYSIVTRWGEFLDPLADKLLTIFAFISFVQLGIMPFWMLFVIFLRDTIATALRIYAIWQGNPIKTSTSAKLKTTTQMIFIGFIIILIFIKHNIKNVDPKIVDKILHSNFIFGGFLIITFMALYSVAGYLWRYRTSILKAMSYHKSR